MKDLIPRRTNLEFERAVDAKLFVALANFACMTGVDLSMLGKRERERERQRERERERVIDVSIIASHNDMPRCH